MAQPRRAILPLDAEMTGTRTEAEAPVLALASPVATVEAEAAPDASARTPARQKLADAIATVRALEAEIADASAALSEAEQTRWKTDSALAEAEEALERAKPRPYGSHLRSREPHTFRSQEEADAYTALLNMPPPPIEDAKAAVASATDARDSALAAVQFHKRRLEAASDRLQWKRSDIDNAARLAVHFDPAMAALAAETKRLVTQAAAAVRAFDIATNGALLQSDHPYQGSTQPTDFRVDPEGWRLLHRWREALEEIRRDPDAALPMPSVA